MRVRVYLVLACASLGIVTSAQAQALAFADRAPAALVASARLCESGEVAACDDVYRRYREDDGLPTDGSVARQLLGSVCEARAYVPHSARIAALRVAERRAAPCFRVLATVVRAQCDAGDGAACLELVSAYRAGRGVARSVRRARALLQTLCDAPSASATRASACDELGAMVEAGVRASRAAALPIYERACVDSAGSCERLGSLYETGALGPIDLELARARYDRACTVGRIPHACAQLARLAGSS